MQTAMLQQVGSVGGHWQLSDWAWRVAGDCDITTLLDLILNPDVEALLQDSKMEFLAAVVANKNQISALSPLVGSNWPGIVVYILSSSSCTYFVFAALKKLDLTSNQLTEVPGGKVSSFSSSAGNA